MEPRRIYAFAYRQVRCQLAQALTELPLGAQPVAALDMVPAHRHVNQRLQKQPPRPALRRPFHFQHLVAFEELGLVEQLDPSMQHAHCSTGSTIALAIGPPRWMRCVALM